MPYESRLSWLAANHIDIIACLILGVLGCFMTLKTVLPTLLTAASQAVKLAARADQSGRAETKSKVS